MSNNALSLARPPAGPNELGFPVHPLGDGRPRNVYERATPFTPYGVVERDKQTNDLFRETMGGIVKMIVEEFALANIGPLAAACTIHPITNPNTMRVVVKRRIMKPGRYQQTASFGIPHILTSRETQQEVTAQRYIIGAYAESVYTETPEGAARLVAAMRQIGFAWTRTIQAELIRALFEESAPVGATSAQAIVRESDAGVKSAMLAEHCLNLMRLVALPRKRLDGKAILRDIVNEEARSRNQPAPDAIFVAEGFDGTVPVGPEQFRAANSTEAVANMAIGHTLPAGAYVAVPAILEGNRRDEAFAAHYPIGLFHPGFDPVRGIDDYNPLEMSSALQSTTIADHNTRRWVTIHARHVLDNCGLFRDGDGRLSAYGDAFFGGGEYGTLNGFLRANGINLEADNPLCGKSGLFDAVLRDVTKASVLRHVNENGLLPFGYVVLRNVLTYAGAAIATCGKPVDALIGSASLDSTKTALLEQLATSVGFLGARVTNADGVIHLPGVVPIRIVSGGGLDAAQLADFGDRDDMANFRERLTVDAKSWVIVPVWPGEVERLIQAQVVYPNFRDPASGEDQIPSWTATAGLRQTLSKHAALTLDQVLRGGVGARRPAFYARSHTFGAVMGATGQPEYRAERCVDAILGSGQPVKPDSFSNLYQRFVF